jgi:hypothetical protein
MDWTILFFKFLMDTPVVACFVLLALLVTVVPLGAAIYGRYCGTAKRQGGEEKAPATTRFVGIQMDIAILVFGLLLLFGLFSWIGKTFSK